MDRVIAVGAALGPFGFRRAVSLSLALAVCSVGLWGFASLLVQAGPTAPRWTAMLPLYVIAMSSLWIWSDLFEWERPCRDR